MSANFSVIPVRQNSQQVEASWWNALRTAGIALEAIVTGIGGVAEMTQVCLNTQTDTNITGLLLSTTYKKHIIDYWVKRISTAGGGVTVIESGQYVALYDGTSWLIGRSNPEIGYADFQMTIDSSTGQVAYTTGTQAGTYDSVNSKIGYTLVTRGV